MKWGLYATAIYESDNERFTASLGYGRMPTTIRRRDEQPPLDQLARSLSHRCLERSI
ncbi:MAG: hypothetical protein ACLR6J_05815 [Parabacteroides merdae]